MGLFTKRQSDQLWLADIRPAYEAAVSVTFQLNQALDEDSLGQQFQAVESVLNRLPMVIQSIKQVPEPSSAGARKANKALKKALRKYLDAAISGRGFFKNIASGPGHRAANETGMARRAAVGRLAFGESLFKNISKEGRSELEKVSTYLLQTGG